ncbi:MAG: ATP-binding cassette domain-containing protein, partial [Bacteroidales bacterium]|nr:ATP-binding cassette domain-containing protein [Bacteroidales bacterium]
VSAGEILIDGINVKEMEIDFLRSLFSLVSQEVVLFNDTILNNIGFGLSYINETAVIEAAKIANAHDFITQLPEGYDTHIGDRGLTLSGGQRQRISIARAILRNAPILVLDEATSAMDTESEKLVQQAIDRFMEHRTSMIIAHRLSTIKNADLIIVLENGKIIETGTHDQLLVLQGKYAQLVAINSFQ